ncbi:MAG: stage V sporulation protein B [Gracilibacter sp. BRH_c7a]|nr:MAG: stage V sporulation protein B [Gracilibacter sp. BRH_c7a]
MPKNSLLYGAAILFAANLINRILGFIYQYLIMRYVGSEAYGLFYMVFPVYMTALVLTTAGIPLAISKLVSEKVSMGHYGEAQKVFRVAFMMLLLSGFLVSLILYLNIPFIVNSFFSDPRIITVFKICIPSVFVVSIASAFRGYFQGLQNMIPSAMSQIFEQILRVTLGFTLSIKLLNHGVEWAAAGLAMGMLAGEILGLFVILIHYLRYKTEVKTSRLSTEPTRKIMTSLLGLSLPITGSRLMSTGLSALDAAIIPRQLQVAGYTSSSAASLFGQFSGTAVTLLTFPSVFTFALATSLVPAISEAISRNDYKLAEIRCLDALRYTIVLGLPCVLVLFYFADPLTKLFNSSEVATVLRVLAIGGLFAYIQQTTTGILQGLGRTFLPLLHSTISAVFRIPLLIHVTSIPKWGLVGSAWVYVLSFFCIAVLNMIAIKHSIKLTYHLKNLIVQPIIAGIGMVILFRIISLFTVLSMLSCLISTFLGFMIYFTILFVNGGITKADLRKIPFFNKHLKP